MCAEKPKVQSQRVCDSSKFSERFFGASELHLKLEIRCNRTDCVSRRIIITIAGLIVGEVVSLRITEFRRKVFERASTNLADVSQIHRMCIMQHGWMWVSIRSSFFVLYGSVHFGTNVRVWKAGDTRNRRKKMRDKTPRERLKLFIVHIVESNGRN